MLVIRVGGRRVEFAAGVTAEPTVTGLLLVRAADGRVVETAAPGDWEVLDDGS